MIVKVFTGSVLTYNTKNEKKIHDHAPIRSFQEIVECSQGVGKLDKYTKYNMYMSAPSHQTCQVSCFNLEAHKIHYAKSVLERDNSTFLIQLCIKV